MPANIGRQGKFGNIKRGYYNINGVEYFFRSKWEANYALYLNFLIAEGKIKKWEYEKKVFVFDAIKFGIRSYRPDFGIYNIDDTIEYHEIKGYMDAKSKTKLKRIKKYYPDIKIVLIDSKYMKSLNKWSKLLGFF